jgi:hypothetical protein
MQKTQQHRLQNQRGSVNAEESMVADGWLVKRIMTSCTCPFLHLLPGMAKQLGPGYERRAVPEAWRLARGDSPLRSEGTADSCSQVRGR